MRRRMHRSTLAAAAAGGPAVRLQSCAAAPHAGHARARHGGQHRSQSGTGRRGQPAGGRRAGLGAVPAAARGHCAGPGQQPRPARGRGEHRARACPVRHHARRPAAQRQRPGPGQPCAHGRRHDQRHAGGIGQHPVHGPAGLCQLRDRPLGPRAQPQRGRAAAVPAKRAEPAQCADRPGGRRGQRLAHAGRRPGPPAAGTRHPGQPREGLRTDAAHA